jgi:hypothetical protein
MKVEQMTAAEELLFYEAGCGTVGALYYSKQCPTPVIAEARWRLLRNNAHRLVWARCRMAAGCAVLLVCVTGVGTAFGRLYRQPIPRAQGAAPSPHVDQVEQLRANGAYR